jgi:Zn-dependent protease with chaperone function
MNFLLLLSLSALIALAIVNAMLSLLVELTWRLRPRTGPHGANGLFLLRIAPTALSVAFVLLAFVPAFLVHEPRDSTERINLWIVLAALPGLVMITASAWRAVTVWRATRRYIRLWKNEGRPIELPGWDGPAFRIDDAPSGPGVFVAGLHRPALFLDGDLLANCTRSELAAIVAHERAHRLAGDNAKRLAMRCLSDLFAMTPSAGAIESAWSEAAEQEADDEAVRSRTVDGIDLASAIVKVARRVCAPASVLAASAFHAGGSVARRVRRLIAFPPASALPAASRRIPWIALASLALFPLIPGLSLRLHGLTETVVKFLTSL